MFIRYFKNFFFEYHISTINDRFGSYVPKSVIISFIRLTKINAVAYS
jgi:hypothetical protein